MIAAIFIAIATSSHPLRTATVDVCELNHVIGEDNQERFVQVILWRWYSRAPEHVGHHVAQWMMLEGEARVETKGLRTRVIWRGKGPTAYEVSARTFRETWTRHDPEADDREAWPQSWRKPYFEDVQRWGD